MNEEAKPEVSIRPLKEKVRADGVSTMDYLIRITAPAMEEAAQRTPLNLGLVLDRSGSMSGRKLHKVKEAVKYCLRNLSNTDRFSLTVFNDRVRVIFPNNHPTDRRRINAAIDGIRSGGDTALHNGWITGINQTVEFRDTKQLNRVILMTDGLANRGITDQEVIVSQSEELHNQGVSTTTIGVGGNFNEDLLEAMAEKGGGNNWLVETPDDFHRIFETEMDGLIREWAGWVILRFDPEPGVEILDVLNDFDAASEGGHALPNLISGDPLDIVVRVRLPGGAPGRARAFRMTLLWTERGEEERSSLDKGALVTYAPADEAANSAVDPEVDRAVELLEAARAKQKAVMQMDGGDILGAAMTLRESSAGLRKKFQDNHDLELANLSVEMENLAKSLQDERKRSMSRKSMKYSSSHSRKGKKVKE